MLLLLNETYFANHSLKKLTEKRTVKGIVDEAT